MLEPQTYRATENAAKTQLSSWRIAQPHSVDHFQQEGFPVRVNSIRELSQLLDTMQENRFASYMAELGGLQQGEYDLLLEACKDSVRFQQIYFPRQPKILPVSTLLSAFALYRKLLAADPDFRSVLEIGPGCGYLSFFLRRHAALRNYSQIEACESFYVLQNLVNLHCFGRRFEEHALPPESTSAVDYFVRGRIEVEISPRVQIRRPAPLCDHYPWWRLGEVSRRDEVFDIVTSNANLLEFNAAALEDYLELLHKTLKPSGVFVVQCTGHEASGTFEQLLAKLYDSRFAVLFLAIKHQPMVFSSNSPPALPGNETEVELEGGVAFTTNNALLVKSGHPLFERYYSRDNYKPGFIAPEAIVERTFFRRAEARRTYSVLDLVKAVENSLSEEGGSGPSETSP